MVKLFFSDALPGDDARQLLDAITRRSQERLAALRAIEPAASAAEEEGNLYPMLTLRMGIGYHQAVIDVCQDFEHKLVETSSADHNKVAG